jgi:hypothetical protein
LQYLFCYNNKISGDNMTALVNSLPDRNGKEEGKFCVIDKDPDTEQNVITAAQAAVATGKNWIVVDSDGNPYTPPGDIFNPLSLVAKYNVNPAGTGFVTSLTDCTVSGYFNFDDAVDQFTNITIGGKQYHLPSIEEWCSIVPNSEYVLFVNKKSYDDISETVTIQGTSITMTSDIRTGVEGVSYALRYKGTDMVSAWRYEYIDEDWNNTHMKITSRSLKGQTGVTVEDIAKPAFWSANGDNDVTRHFPASGEYWEGSLSVVRISGCFWSSSPNSSYAWNMGFGPGAANSNYYNNRSKGYSVRLFSSGD